MYAILLDPVTIFCNFCLYCVRFYYCDMNLVIKSFINSFTHSLVLVYLYLVLILPRYVLALLGFTGILSGPFGFHWNLIQPFRVSLESYPALSGFRGILSGPSREKFENPCSRSLFLKSCSFSKSWSTGVFKSSFAQSWGQVYCLNNLTSQTVWGSGA